jgi:hypothetical protein
LTGSWHTAGAIPAGPAGSAPDRASRHAGGRELRDTGWRRPRQDPPASTPMTIAGSFDQLAATMTAFALRAADGPGDVADRYRRSEAPRPRVQWWLGTFAPPHLPISTVPFTWAIVWPREVLHGGVNPPAHRWHARGEGSNPLSSTRHNASSAHPLTAVCQQISFCVVRPTVSADGFERFQGQ